MLGDRDKRAIRIKTSTNWQSQPRARQTVNSSKPPPYQCDRLYIFNQTLQRAIHIPPKTRHHHTDQEWYASLHAFIASTYFSPASRWASSVYKNPYQGLLRWIYGVDGATDNFLFAALFTPSDFARSSIRRGFFYPDQNTLPFQRVPVMAYATPDRLYI